MAMNPESGQIIQNLWIPGLRALHASRNDDVGSATLEPQARVRIRIMKLSKLNSATCIHASDSLR
jgi:hypothetical protein